jgi:hypothetical protein
LFLRSSSSCLRLLSILLAISILSSTFSSIMYFRRQFLGKMWPYRFAFLVLMEWGYSCPLWQYVILHFSHDQSKWSFHSSPAPHFKSFQGFCSTFCSVHFSAPYKRSYRYIIF